MSFDQNNTLSVTYYSVMKSTWPLILLITISCCSPAYASCIDEAAAQFNVPVQIINAISEIESRNNPTALHLNQDGSYDIGYMQINSGWAPTLMRYGIDEQKLFDLCTNVYVGTWILANNIKRLGYRWEAIGAYNARDKHKRDIYMHKVAVALIRG